MSNEREISWKTNKWLKRGHRGIEMRKCMNFKSRIRLSKRGNDGFKTYMWLSSGSERRTLIYKLPKVRRRTKSRRVYPVRNPRKPGSENNYVPSTRPSTLRTLNWLVRSSSLSTNTSSKRNKRWTITTKPSNVTNFVG